MPELVQLTVAEVVEALAASPPGGGSDLAQEIIRRFEPLLRHAWRRGGFDVEYPDFVQEVFTELFGGLRGLQHAAAFPGYFRRVALSVAARFARRARREPEAPPETLQDLGQELFARAALRSVLERLPAREREVVEALFLEGAPVTELAHRLGIEPGAVRTTKSRALRRLREIFGAEAAALETVVRER